MTDRHPRIFGHMVARNEGDRYLRQCIRWHLPHLDAFHVFDDCSEDDTLFEAAASGAVVDRRTPAETAFIDNEAEFRQAAWRSMERHLRPERDDWILCIDADEFFMSTHPAMGDLRAALEELAASIPLTGAGEGTCNAAAFPVEELWGDDGERTYKRIDGYWGSITAERFVRYQPNGKFKKRRGLGGGSLPSYARRHPRLASGVAIMHAGYLDSRDRLEKWKRYTQTRGHGSKHVNSVLSDPELHRLDEDQRCGAIREAPWRMTTDHR